jgi:anti-anti-sigma factor
MTEVAAHDAGPPGGLTIQRLADAQGIILALAGELDLQSAPELDRQIRELGETSPGRLLIDLSALEFMDSTGLSVMIRAQRSASANGHRLSLRRGSTQVQRLFELTGVVEHFAFED